MKNLRKVVFALGSNVGNRRENLVKAVAEIEKFAAVFSRSKIYETEPVGFADQRDFLNAAVAAETDFEPLELLSFCKSAETALGRVKTFVNGPRAIDIDIIFYGGERVVSDILEIPHPRWKLRDFVVSPLLDLLDAGALSDDAFAEVRSELAKMSKKYTPFSSF